MSDFISSPQASESATVSSSTPPSSSLNLSSGAAAAVELVEFQSAPPSKPQSQPDRTGSPASNWSLSLDSLCVSLNTPIPPVKASQPSLSSIAPNSKPKEILRSISGRFFPGQICAILGSSGSGKTTLLNLLSGRNRPDHMTASGEIYLNVAKAKSSGSDAERLHAPVPASQRDLLSSISFVPQFDLHWSSLTPLESMLFTIELRHPGRWSAEQKAAKAESLLRSVGLWAARMTQIGDAEAGNGNSGLSGGEKRRLSVALALLDDSPIYLLDEFVTGLDSLNSYLLLALVRQLASDQGKTILLTIHQPISELFGLFDSLLVLEQGSVIYHGPRENFLPYFARLNFHCPENSNPLDFLFLNVVNSVDEEKEKEELEAGDDADAGHGQDSIERQKKRIDGFIESWKGLKHEYEYSQAQFNSQSLAKSANSDSGLLEIEKQKLMNPKDADSGIASDPESNSSLGPSSSVFFPYFGRFLTLFRRNFLLQYRNPAILFGRLAQQAFSFLFLGLMFSPLGDSFQSRLGAIFYVANNGLMAALFSTQTLYYNEKPLYLREYSNGLYSRLEYYWARILAELASRVMFPVSPACAIVGYLIIGFQLEADKLVLFAFLVFALDFSGSAMGFALSCCIPTAQLCLALTPMIVFPLGLMTGYYLHLPSLHWALRWISYISPSRYGFQAMVVNEFRGLKGCSSETLFSTASGSGDGSCLQGSDVIEFLGFSDNQNQNIYGEALIQFGFTLVFLAIGAIGFNYLKANGKAGK